MQVEITSCCCCCEQSCTACLEGKVQNLFNAVLECTVINCILRPINMLQVLFLRGQTLLYGR